MTLNDIVSTILKPIKSLKTKETEAKLINWNYFFYIFLIIVFFLVCIIVSNLINEKIKKETKNLNTIVKSDEFVNLGDFFLSKIKSPYKEERYLIKNNDSVEKILKKFDIDNKDIKNISNKLKIKKLSNIYADRELSLVYKKLEDSTKTVISLIFPINKTLSIEVRKSQSDFVIKENILKLYKKEVVVKKEIRNNLYSAAVEANRAKYNN